MFPPKKKGMKRKKTYLRQFRAVAAAVARQQFAPRAQSIFKTAPNKNHFDQHSRYGEKLVEKKIKYQNRNSKRHATKAKNKCKLVLSNCSVDLFISTLLSLFASKTDFICATRWICSLSLHLHAAGCGNLISYFVLLCYIFRKNVVS